MTTDKKSRIQPEAEDPSLSPDFLKFMDQLLAEHAWDENDLTGGLFGNRFRTPLFDFLQSAKSRPEMRDLAGTEALRWIHRWQQVRSHQYFKTYCA